MNIFKYDEALCYVTQHLSDPALLGALAEEAAELAAAALKLQRVIMNESPTPVTLGEAQEALIEEIGDTLCCVDAISFPLLLCYSSDIRPKAVEKALRWADRIFDSLNPEEQAEAEEGDNGEV